MTPRRATNDSAPSFDLTLSALTVILKVQRLLTWPSRVFLCDPYLFLGQILLTIEKLSRYHTRCLQSTFVHSDNAEENTTSSVKMQGQL